MIERQRANNFNVRLTDDEAEMLRMLAEQSGMSQSDVARQLVRREFAALGLKLKRKR